MKQLRVEAKLKNAILWHFIYDRYGSIAEFSRKQNYSLGIRSQICSIINLRIYPAGAKGFWTIAKQLAELFNVIPEVLFPEQLYKLPKTKAAIDVSLAEIESPRRRLQMLPQPEHQIYAKEIERIINEALDELTLQEAEVVRSHFVEEKKYVQIAKNLNLSKTRISQIERKALEKMRTKSELRVANDMKDALEKQLNIEQLKYY